MAVEIHVPVENANDVNPAVNDAVKYDVRTREIFPIAFANIVARFTALG